MNGPKCLVLGGLVAVVAACASAGGAPSPSLATMSTPESTASSSATDQSATYTLTPLAKPYEQAFGPSFPDRPPAGERTRVEDASVSDDGRSLTLAFTGGRAYTAADFCSTDYAPWVAADGSDLQVAVVVVAHTEQATAPPDSGCGDVGHGYTFHLQLPRPFTGSTVHDLDGRDALCAAASGSRRAQIAAGGVEARVVG